MDFPAAQQEDNREEVKAQPQYRQPLYHNQKLNSRNAVFGIILGILQISFCFLYGFLFRVPPEVINMTSIITAIALAILIIPGFGLLFGYTKKLVWSGMGFNLFIVAFCIEFYPLINNFWTKTQIQSNNSPLLDFSYSNRFYDLYLANRDTLPSANYTGYGNCIVNAMKCGLAMAVAFSSILGRAGQLQCLIVCLVGTIGYELNRQLIQERIGTDSFESFIIFTYGGFMGLALGLFAYLREKKEECSMEIRSLRKYTPSSESALNSVLGAIIIFIFLPFLAYEIDAYAFQNTFAPYVSPVIIILAMGAGVAGGLIFSMLYNGYIILRDVTHGAIAGAIATGAASLYIFNPAYAIISGFLAGMMQGFFQNVVEKIQARKGTIVSTFSWILFGINGFFGGLTASGWKDNAKVSYSSVFSTFVTENFGAQNEMYIMLISVGMGLAFGILAGLLTYLTNALQKTQYFEDGYYWKMTDGIRTFYTQNKVPIKEEPVRYDEPVKQSEPVREQERIKQAPVYEEEPIRDEQIQLEFRQASQQEVKNQHAYL